MHTFCWIDLCTSDLEGAKAFYGGLFGWTAEAVSTCEGPPYTMLRSQGKDVGAVYEREGVPPQWKGYVEVESVDDTVEKAQELGATVVLKPVEVSETGRTAILRDPTGAAFALWQTGEPGGFGLKDAPNTFCWEELVTTDVPKAQAFYRRLLGWTTLAQQNGPQEYHRFQREGRDVGGMLQRPEGMQAPPHWATYFAVEDVDAAVKKALELGGSLCKPAADIPGVGRFAVLFDPQGAVFYVLCLAL